MLQRGLKDADGGVRCALLAAAAELYPEQAEALAAAALADPDWRPRMQAVELLGTIRTKSSIDELIHALSDGRPAVAARAQKELQELTGMKHTRRESWEAWWKENRETFTFPAGRAKVAASDERTVATYNGVRIASDHAAFLLDKSSGMSARLKSKDSTKEEAALQELEAALTRLQGQLTFNYSDQDIEAYAFFGNVEFKLTDSLTLIGGARYTKTNRDFQGCTNDYQGGTAIWWNALFGTNVQPGGCLTLDPTLTPYNPAVFDQLNEDNISWNVGVNYQTPGDTLFYGRVSRGYKSGSFPTASVASGLGYTPVTQESVTAYEVGIKAPLADRKLELTAAAFYYDYKDKQLRGRLPDPVFGTLDGLVQIPKSRVQGIEFSMLARPVDGLRISIGGTYIDTKIQEFIGFQPDATTADFKGQRFPLAPKLTAIADAEYEFPVGSSVEAYLGVSATHNSKTSSTLANSDTATINRDARFDMRGYTLVDLRAGINIPDSKIRAGVFVRNVGNVYYWTNVQDTLASVSRFAGMPRTYGVQVSWRY